MRVGFGIKFLSLSTCTYTYLSEITEFVHRQLKNEPETHHFKRRYDLTWQYSECLVRHKAVAWLFEQGIEEWDIPELSTCLRQRFRVCITWWKDLWECFLGTLKLKNLLGITGKMKKGVGISKACLLWTQNMLQIVSSIYTKKFLVGLYNNVNCTIAFITMSIVYCISLIVISIWVHGLFSNL